MDGKMKIIKKLLKNTFKSVAATYVCYCECVRTDLRGRNFLKASNGM
jgi:hypothetical protein